MSKYSDAVLALNPVAYWRLGDIIGSSIAVDEMGISGGTYNGGVTLESRGLVVDDVDTCAYFNGTDDHVSIPHNVLFSSNDQTIVGSFRAPSSISIDTKGILYKAPDTGYEREFGLIIRPNTGYLDFGISDGVSDSTGSVYTSDSICDGEIHHFVAIKKHVTSNDFIELYVDGVSVASASIGYNGFQGINEIVIGKVSSISTVERHYTGDIDEIALFDKVLTPAEITNLYNTFLGYVELPANYKETVLHYFPKVFLRLGEASGTDAFDEMGQYDGIYGNTPTLGVAGLLTLDADTAVDLNSAQTEYVQTGLTLSASANRTWSIVFKPDNLTDHRIIMADTSDGSASKGRIMLGFNDIGDWYFAVGDGAVSYTSQNIPHNLVAGTQYHLVIVQTDNIYQTYVDKVLAHTFTSSVDVSAIAGVSPLVVGRSGAYNGWFFDGTVDEFFVINDSLSQDAVDVIYNAYQGNFLSSQAFNIVIDHTKVDEDLYNFPLLVNLDVDSGIDDFDSSVIFDNIEGSVPDNVKILNAIYINPADNTSNNYNALMNSLNPLAYWRLSESLGAGVAVDETDVFNGTYQGGPTLGVDGLVVGDLNTAMEIDGLSQYVTIPDVINDDTVAMGVSFIWKSPVSGDADIPNTLIGLQHMLGLRRIDYNDVSDEITMYNYDGVTSHKVSAPITFNTIYHVVALFDMPNQMGYLYVNNVEFSGAIGATTNVSSDTGNYICSSAHSTRYYAKGVVDEVAIFDKLLTPEEVENLYNSSIDSKSLPADSTIISQQCKVEVDRWDQVNQQAQLWIKIPYISKDTDTIINLSYDVINPDNSDNIGYTGEVPAQLVWSGYDAVYHLSKDGADSTFNALDGALVNIDDNNIVDFGIGKGMTFNGTDEYVDCGDVNDVLLSDMSLFAIININDMSINQNYVNKANISPDEGRYFNGISSNKARLFIDALDDKDLLGNTTLLNNTTYSIGSNFDRDADGTIYVNGVNDGSIDISDGDGISLDTQTPFRIGAYTDVDNTTPVLFTEGKLKEIRFSKTLKTPGWIGTDHDSTQDTLVRYSNADAFILAKTIFGSITENVAVTDWIVRANRLDTGAFVSQLLTVAGAFNLPIPNGQWYPMVVTVTPEQGILWTGNTAQLVDDLVFPTDPETTPYYFKCTVSGTGIDGVTGSIEPAWPTVPGNTVVDGTVTWEVVERMIQPITHSPMIPK